MHAMVLELVQSDYLIARQTTYKINCRVIRGLLEIVMILMSNLFLFRAADSEVEQVILS